MTTRRSAVLAVAVLAMVSLACSAFAGLIGGEDEALSTTSAETPVSTGSVQGPGCGEAELAETSGDPGEPIPIEGLPTAGSPDNYTVAFMFANLDEPVEMPLIQFAEDQIATLAPLHVDGIQGGQAAVTLHSGSDQCFESDFQILGIEPAPGAFDEYSQQVIKSIELNRRLYGYDRSELLEDDTILPPLAIPLALVERSFGEGPPPTSGELKDTLAWLAPEADLEDLDQETLDAVAAHFELADQLQRQNEADQELLDQLQATSGSHFLSAQSQLNFLEIGSALALHSAMEKQARCAGESDSPLYEGRRAGESFVDLYLNAKLPTKGIPALKILSAVRTRQKLMEAACERMLPSELVVLVAEPTIQWFPEDWQGPDGAVTKVSLTASAEGLNFKNEINALTSDESVQSSLRTIAEGICSASSHCSEQHLTVPGFSVDVDVFHKDWITAELSGESISLETSPPYPYGPIKRGVSHIVIRTLADRFGSAEPAETRVPIHVEECLDEGLSAPEGNYQTGIDPFELTCVPPGNTITYPGAVQTWEITHLDDLGCRISVSTDEAQFTAARIASEPTYSKYEGVLDVGAATCGVSLTWNPDRQTIIGDFNCYAESSVGVCFGGTGFSME